jgi:hypothetical protein
MLLTFLNCMSYKQTGTWAFRDRLQVFSRTVAAPRQGPSSRSQSWAPGWGGEVLIKGMSPSYCHMVVPCTLPGRKRGGWRLVWLTTWICEQLCSGSPLTLPMIKRHRSNGRTFTTKHSGSKRGRGLQLWGQVPPGPVKARAQPSGSASPIRLPEIFRLY